MFIFKDTKSYVKGISDLTSIKRDGEAVKDCDVYCVDDDTELAAKVAALFPDYEFVLDEEGHLADVAAIPHIAGEEELRQNYELLVVEKIRERYSQNDEYKILREALASGLFDEFDLYNAYVEQCKAEAHGEVYGNDVPADQSE